MAHRFIRGIAAVMVFVGAVMIASARPALAQDWVAYQATGAAYSVLYPGAPETGKLVRDVAATGTSDDVKSAYNAGLFQGRIIGLIIALVATIGFTLAARRRTGGKRGWFVAGAIVFGLASVSGIVQITSELASGTTGLTASPAPAAKKTIEVNFSKVTYGDNTRQFVGSYFDLDAAGPATAVRTQASLNGFQDGILASTHGRLARQTDIDLGGIPGREVVIEIDGPHLTMIARDYVGDHRIYQFTALGPTGFNSDPDVTKFFGSIRLEPR